MAVDCFLKVDSIKGESSDSKHGGEIEILSWSWGATQTASYQSGSGGGTAKVSVQDLTVTKYVDRSTPTLLGLCFTGAPITQAVLTVRKAGGTALEYVKITMEQAVVSSITSNNGVQDSERLTESLTLNFSRVKFDYTPQKPDQSADATVKFAYDIAKNTTWG